MPCCRTQILPGLKQIIKEPFMGKIKEVLKKTPLREAWWKIKGVPPIKQVRDYLGDIHEDKLYYEWIPDIYKKAAIAPVDEKKVILVENHPKNLSNTFQELYKDLIADGSYVHIHHLGKGYIHREDHEKNVAKLVKDLGTARYVFQSEANEAISALTLRPETKVIQLWHACGAFKKFGRSTMDALFGQDRTHADRHPFYKNYDLVTVSSPEIVWAYAEAMGIDESDGIIQPMGVSRTDVFFDQEYLDTAAERVYSVVPQARDKKIILFAPTFRGKVAIATTPDYETFNLRQLKEALGDDVIVLIKNHPHIKDYHTPKIPEDLKGTFAVDVSKKLSIEDLMIAADICITDYSSLIFEYSLLNKPLVFYAYDLDDYDDWRGFYYNYDELTPGPVCRDMNELISALTDPEKLYDPQKMAAFRQKFMSACDGHSTERIEQYAFGRSLR